MADNERELVERVLGTLAQQLAQCDPTQLYNILKIFNAIADGIKHGKDLSPFARYALTFEAGRPHIEVA